ncbi:MAG: type III-B CRISPR module RAMP protein Cmr6 [Pirellulaceae bacterium]|nr:type III-B CRISPR module RAMP protein Cmr6 [Pirellulaceae bacterium]
MEFCPLYQAVSDAEPWEQLGKGNSGLLFSKFGNAWRWERQGSADRVLGFDKPVGRGNQASRWLERFSKKKHGVESELAEFCDRQRELIKGLGGCTIVLKNESRFVTGMGLQHPLENGFTWHHTLGTPYLPASGLKGALRAWYREDVFGESNADAEEFSRRLFGAPGQIGDLILFDLLPRQPVQLVVEIMTPHYGAYYQNKETPGDWHSPTPISFLAVEKCQSWQLGIAPRNPKHFQDGMVEVVNQILDAVQFLGLGAKTAVGMGRFDRDLEAEQTLDRENEKREALRRQEAANRKDEEKFEAELAGLSPELQKLRRTDREQKWKRKASDQKMLDGMKRFAMDCPQPPQDCLEWIQEFLESISDDKYRGVWNDPDAMKGKKKNKPKYGSTIRELVKMLNPKFK